MAAGKNIRILSTDKIWLGSKEDLKELFLVYNFLSFFLPVTLLEVSNKHDAKGIGSTHYILATNVKQGSAMHFSFTRTISRARKVHL